MLLTGLLYQVLEVETELEQARRNLADVASFNLFETFKYFDTLGVGYINFKQFQEGV